MTFLKLEYNYDIHIYNGYYEEKDIIIICCFKKTILYGNKAMKLTKALK